MKYLYSLDTLHEKYIATLPPPHLVTINIKSAQREATTAVRVGPASDIKPSRLSGRFHRCGRGAEAGRCQWLHTTQWQSVNLHCNAVYSHFSFRLADTVLPLLPPQPLRSLSACVLPFVHSSSLLRADWLAVDFYRHPTFFRLLFFLSCISKPVNSPSKKFFVFFSEAQWLYDFWNNLVLSEPFCDSLIKNNLFFSRLCSANKCAFWG